MLSLSLFSFSPLFNDITMEDVISVADRTKVREQNDTDSRPRSMQEPTDVFEINAKLFSATPIDSSIPTSSLISNIYGGFRSWRNPVQLRVATKYLINYSTKIPKLRKIDKSYNQPFFRQIVFSSNPTNPPKILYRKYCFLSFEPKLTLQNPFNKGFYLKIVRKHTNTNLSKIQGYSLPVRKDISGRDVSLGVLKLYGKHDNQAEIVNLVPNAEKKAPKVAKSYILTPNHPSKLNSITSNLETCQPFIKSIRKTDTSRVRHCDFIKADNQRKSAIAGKRPPNRSFSTFKRIFFTQNVSPAHKNSDGVHGKTLSKRLLRRRVHQTGHATPVSRRSREIKIDSSNRKSRRYVTISNSLGNSKKISLKQKSKKHLARIFDQTFDVISFIMTNFQKLYVLPLKFDHFVNESREITKTFLEKLMNTTLNDFLRSFKSILVKFHQEISKFHTFLKKKPAYSKFSNNILKFRHKLGAKFEKLSDMIARNFINLEQNQQILTSVVISLAIIGLYHIFGTFFHSIFM